uniref:Uncharacterized protein n=1 Tax=Oryza brachyantha TaxID=4533 RepID=J3KYG6_ORYBR
MSTGCKSKENVGCGSCLWRTHTLLKSFLEFQGLYHFSRKAFADVQVSADKIKFLPEMHLLFTRQSSLAFKQGTHDWIDKWISTGVQNFNTMFLEKNFEN